MKKFAIRLLTLAILSLTLAAAPVVTAVYAAPDNDPPPTPPPTKGKKAKRSEIRPGIEETAFAKGYRAAYATIYERNDYTAAIEQLKALGHDDVAAVANLIGYSYRSATTRSRRSGTSARSRPTRTTSRPGSITACGSSKRATATRRNII